MHLSGSRSDGDGESPSLPLEVVERDAVQLGRETRIELDCVVALDELVWWNVGSEGAGVADVDVGQHDGLLAGAHAVGHVGLRRFLLVAYAQGQVLCAGQGEYVISEVVLNCMRGCALAGPVVEQLVAHPVRGFADEAA